MVTILQNFLAITNAVTTVSDSVLTSWGESASLALVDHPSCDDIIIKIPYG